MKHVFPIVVSVMLLLSTSMFSFAAPKSSLWSHERIEKGLFSVGLAWGIKENCSTIDENKLKGTFFLLGLNNYAISEGYSSAEVRAFISDKNEKQKLRARVRSALVDAGYNVDKPNELCKLGYSHINADTQVGSLLSVRK